MIGNHTIQEKIILPLSDLLTGQCISKSLKFLMASDKWTHRQIEDFQNKRLQLLIAHAYENVPYYHDVMVERGLKPEDIQTKADLPKLPILTKALAKEIGIERLTAQNFPKSKIIHGHSSGSTGEPFHYLVSKESYSMNIACSLRGWYKMGWRLGDRYIKLSGNSRSNVLKRLQDWVTNNMYISTSPLNDEHIREILEKIEAYKPKIVRCYPDPLVLLARYRAAHKDEFKYVPLAVTTTGNTLFPEMREEIESAFGCKVFDTYSSEGNPNVFECPSHTCYHSSEEYGISEVIDESGNIITSGKGSLVSTDLWNFAHPFIRYRMLDIVEIDDTPCECGNEHLKVMRIWGRENDVLKMPSGKTFIVHDFTIYFEYEEGIEHFQITKKRDDTALIKLEVNEQFTDCRPTTHCRPLATGVWPAREGGNR